MVSDELKQNDDNDVTVSNANLNLDLPKEEVT